MELRGHDSKAEPGPRIAARAWPAFAGGPRSRRCRLCPSGAQGRHGGRAHGRCAGPPTAARVVAKVPRPGALDRLHRKRLAAGRGGRGRAGEHEARARRQAQGAAALARRRAGAGLAGAGRGRAAGLACRKVEVRVVAAAVVRAVAVEQHAHGGGAERRDGAVAGQAGVRPAEDADEVAPAGLEAPAARRERLGADRVRVHGDEHHGRVPCALRVRVA